MASKSTKMRVRNRSKSGDADKFESQSKKFRKGVNEMKFNHGIQRMNVEDMVEVKSSQVPEKEKMTFQTAKKREIWKVANKMTPNQGIQCQNLMNDEVVKVDVKENMTVKATMKRETWNSSCGTDIGVFEKMCDNTENKQQNPNFLMPSKNNASTRKNIRTETTLGHQIFSKKGWAGIVDNSINIEKDNQVADAQKMEEEEVQIILQKIVKPPAIRDIKQENSSVDEEEIEIVYEDLAPTPTILNIKQEQASYQPTVTVSQAAGQSVAKNEQISIRKDIFQNTSKEKLPAGATKSPAKLKQNFGTSEQPQNLASSTQPPGTNSPVNCQQQEEPRRHNTVYPLPFGHPLSQRESENHPGPSKSLATSNQLPGTSKTSKFPVNCEHPEVPTPVGSSASNSVSTTPSGETAGRIKEVVARPQGNSPATNENEQVTRPTSDEAIPSIGQNIKSQENLTVKIDSGEVTVSEGERTVQMKMTGGSISGGADDVNNFVKTLSQVVHDV